MTLRNKLALGSAGALLVMWIVASILVYALVARGSVNQLDLQLRSQQRAVQRKVGVTLNAPRGRRAQRFAERTQTVGIEGNDLPLRLAQRELLGQVIDSSGDVKVSSPAMSTFGSFPAPDTETIQKAQSEREAYTDESINGSKFRVQVSPLGQGQFLQIALPSDDVSAMLKTLRRLLMFSALFATILAALIGRALAEGALRPIARLTHTARRIATTGELSSRIPQGNGSDEVAELSRTFNSMIENLDEAQQAQKRFVADASHELRTPLTSLRGNVEYLARGAGDATTNAQALTDVLEDVERVNSLAGDLLALAKMDAAPALDRKPVNIDDLVRTVGDRHARATTDHTVTFDAASGVTAAVDPDLVDRAVSNLVVNALRYTPAGTNITVGSKPGLPGQVELYVRDNGPGMSVRDAQLAFDRFHRGEQSQGTDGTGLGLAIVQGIAKAHGGNAVVESAPGAGCTVKFSLATV